MLEYQWKRVQASASSNSAYIGEKKAKKLALAEVPGAVVIEIEFEKDDGTAVYEVKLQKGNTEYELKINARTGKILERDIDIED